MPIRPTDDPEIKSMRGINLYHYSQSNCSMRIRLLLEEKGLPWTSHYVDLDTQANLTKDYFKLHPHGLVPTIVHDGEIVYESSDILRYLEEKYPETPLIPADEEQRKEMEKWLDITKDIHVRVIKVWVYGKEKYTSKTPESMKEYEKIQPSQELIDFHKMTLAEGHIPQEKIDEADEILRSYFSMIENNLKKYQWIAGDTMSLADIAWIPNYTLLNMFGFPFENYPRVMKWIDKLVNRPSYEAAVTRWSDYVPAQDSG